MEPQPARVHDNVVTIGGLQVAITNPEKVMYPETGTRKADVIHYYLEIADVMLPYLIGRPVTRKRWVDGVQGRVFFQRDLDTSTPKWVSRQLVHHKKRDIIYPVLDEKTGAATLIWFAQIAALELHVPQWRFTASGTFGNPDRMVFDLDPGEGVGLRECAEVATMIRTVLNSMGLESVPVTSGGRGIHVYAWLDAHLSSWQINNIGHEIARSMEADHPDLIVSNLSKAKRRGKILIDWSQNNASKTTISPYSLRGAARPTVAMPRSWEEISSQDLRQIEMNHVLSILRHRGDTAKLLQTPRPDPLHDSRSTCSTTKCVASVSPLLPGADVVQSGRSFVIQKHSARSVHYDLRLEHHGTLASWVLPKGIPDLGKANHLAVQVEDHPLDYLSFHGTIPAGKYGAGHVDIWDTGKYDLVKWAESEIVIVLHGQIDGGLGGAAARLALIRMYRGKGNDWLIHRMAAKQ